jgi:recombination protein U
MKINYPNPSIKQKPSKSIFNSHGMYFENALNISNKFYRNLNKAIIYKKPTPIQIVKVDYPQRSKARIVEAYYQTPSTTDYNGIYRGKYIDYEAKETNNLSFNFKHISEHQMIHLQKVDEQGGIAFIIIFFKKINKVFIIDIKPFMKVFQDGIKSIKATELEDIGQEVKLSYSPPIDYLTAVDRLYFKTP